MTTKTMVTEDATTTNPVILREGDEIPIAVKVKNVVTGITGTPTQKFFKKYTRTDLAGTYLSATASTVEGTDVIRCRQTQNLKAGEWVMSVKAVVDGVTMVVATIPVIVKREDEL